MTRLSSNDLAALLDLVRSTYAHSGGEALGRHVIRAIHRLVPADNCTYSELDPRRQRRTAVELMDPPELLTPDTQAAFCRYMGDHPVIAYYARTGDGGARKVSDFLTKRQLHELAFYNEYVRPYFGVEYQIAIAVTATPSRIVGIALARSARDFSERDRLLLDLLRPHIVQARRIAEMATDRAALRRGVDVAALGMVAVDATGRVRTMTTRARVWCQQYFGRMSSPTRLPGAIRDWMRGQAGALTPPGDAPAPLRPLVALRDGYRLAIRMAPDDDGYLLLLDEQRTTIDHGGLAAFGLTRREIEVLVWVAAGKTSAETATIVGGRPRTIEKHLERIYRKLGVENRTAASGVVRPLIQGGPV